VKAPVATLHATPFSKVRPPNERRDPRETHPSIRQVSHVGLLRQAHPKNFRIHKQPGSATATHAPIAPPPLTPAAR